MVMMDVAYIVVYPERSWLPPSANFRILSVWSSRALANAAILYYQHKDLEQYKELQVIEKEINVALNK
jgi:hypothetical protein